MNQKLTDSNNKQKALAEALLKEKDVKVRAALEKQMKKEITEFMKVLLPH